ncbi:TonB-dependent hemoglobin/transferrin/lactoferrin family receptor [Rubritalea tangerina]|uniref:TonB-dependent hemoglobin/transferrin/lactoferrin family receptor n=2 Tax=Rubritalea tangerina TaxID=430798 RepID=A0ABW4ZC98_9BACT
MNRRETTGRSWGDIVQVIVIGGVCFPTLSWAEESKNTDPVEVLDETVVVATANETPWLRTSGSVAQMTRSDFTAMGGSDFGDIVRYDPTVTAPLNIGSGDGTFGYGQTGYTGYNIRGVGGNRVLMLVDGIRQPEQFVSTSFDQSEGSAGGAGRDYYDPMMFEVTEILKGSASALYGSDAMAGVVSFRTPDPEDFLIHTDRDFAGLVQGQYFSHNESFAQQAFFAAEHEALSFLFGYARRDGSETKNNGETPPNPVDFSSDSVLLKMRVANDNGHDLLFAYEHFRRARFVDVQSAQGFIPIFNKFVYNWEDQERSRYSLQWFYEPMEGRNLLFDSIDTHAYFQDTKNFSRNQSESEYGRERLQDISFDTEIAGLRTTLRKKTEKQLLTYGVDGSISNSENRFIREDNGLPPLPNRIAFAPSETTRVSAFVQSEFQPSEGSRWSFVAGAGFDYYGIDPNLTEDYIERIDYLSGARDSYAPAEGLENFSISPKFNVVYALDDRSSLYGQYARGTRNPTAEELSMIFDHPPVGGGSAGSITLPNSDLKEESSHALEAGYKYFNGSSRFHLASFYTKYSDLIENGVRTGAVTPEGRDILTTVNRGEATFYGYELSGEYDLLDLHTSLNGLYIGASVGQTWGIDNERNSWINSVEPWKGVSWIGYRSAEDRFGARVTGTYVGEVKHVDDSVGGPYFRPPGYFTLDVSGYYRLSENVTLQAGVNNLLDRKYWQWGNSRRVGGHLPNDLAVDDRSTAPGTNGFVTLSLSF